MLFKPNAQTLMGQPIFIAPAFPRMRTSEAFNKLQSPELVASTNAWMTAFFGRESMLEFGKVFQLEDRLVMSQETYDHARSKGVPL